LTWKKEKPKGSSNSGEKRADLQGEAESSFFRGLETKGGGKKDNARKGERGEDGALGPSIMRRAKAVGKKGQDLLGTS